MQISLPSLHLVYQTLCLCCYRTVNYCSRENRWCTSQGFVAESQKKTIVPLRITPASMPDGSSLHFFLLIFYVACRLDGPSVGWEVRNPCCCVNWTCSDNDGYPALPLTVAIVLGSCVCPLTNRWEFANTENSKASGFQRRFSRDNDHVMG